MKPEHGLGLIDVLISTVVLSVGLLGATAMQVRAQGAANNAHWQHLALHSAQEMAQAMRSNAPAFDLGGYTASEPDGQGTQATAFACTHGACSSGARAEHDVAQWRERLAERLPSGRGVLQATGPKQRQLVVMWASPSTPPISPCPPPWPSEFNCLRLAVWL
ncbi:MAG: hypothetical protein RL297_1394 [Pseudomonadota bacterium]|jgi:type IV pilus assembly protein PilV